jgi:hypothetical protein
MPEMSTEERDQRARGQRAEQVAEWYFRLNGFLLIPGFIVHIDRQTANGSQRYARTEADLMGVRFPHSRETIDGRNMPDAPWIVESAVNSEGEKPLFVLVEVKAGICNMNGPWSNSANKNMQRVIRRLGFADQDKQIDEIASVMYSKARWSGDAAIFQYVCVGKEKNKDLDNQYRNHVQVDWRDVGAFLFDRFADFPDKLPNGHVHKQWPNFGRKYGDWFVRQGQSSTNLGWSEAVNSASSEAVKRFIDTGSCT